EALAKTTHLRDLDLTWHYIGRVQSNKTRHIATHFEWLHTLDRDKIASRLSEQLPTGRRLQCLVQVNIDADPAKAGVHVDDVRSLVHACERYQNLQLRGLMTILDPQSDPAASYRSMAQLAARIRDDLRPAAADRFDCLSMGMTADLEAAVAAGATHIRIGTALFGPRPSGVDAPSNAQANSDADAVVDDKRHDRNER
ncbi:MAG: YggS family pyridoxal phosphate-dependent enzyme, partial [Pseudomonadota bacterium]